MILLDEAMTAQERLNHLDLDGTFLPVQEKIAEYIRICGDHLGVEVRPVLECGGEEWEVVDLVSGYTVEPTTITHKTIAGDKVVPGFQVGHWVEIYNPGWGYDASYIEDGEVHTAWQAATMLMRLAVEHSTHLKLTALGC